MSGEGTMTRYDDFLAAKAQAGVDGGFEPSWMPDQLFDFQRSLVDWSVRKGRAAIFADCGLGKTPMQLTWAENVARKTDGRVLILTPLAVGVQTIREAEKFAVECGRDPRGRIVVANYERLHHFEASDFVAVVCDESSILKSFNGVRRGEITEFMRRVPYRLLCTATAAPNDYTELGTSSEALGYLGHMDMLNRFFKRDEKFIERREFHGGAAWRLKGHAEEPFWRWVCSWARAARKPSDLGFEDAAFVLPELVEREHVVTSESVPDGMLFSLPAADLHEQRAERRRTIDERCERVAELVSHDQPALVWCHLNDEGDRLARLIPESVQVSGGDPEDEKEGKFLDFIEGRARVLVTKPKIGAWGLNFQHCAHVVTFASHSFESYYQSVRRCWRFGQTRPVTVDIVTTDGERAVVANLRQKAASADRMFSRLTEHMREALSVMRDDRHTKPLEVPAWL